MKEKLSFDHLPSAMNQVLSQHEQILLELNALRNNQEVKPHLTRKETAEFFGISLNCLNDWSRKGIVTPYKVGQRTYFKRSELIQVLFNQPKCA